MPTWLVVILLIVVFRITLYSRLLRFFRNRAKRRAGMVLVEIGIRDPFGGFIPCMGPTHIWVHQDILEVIRKEHNRVYTLCRKEINKLNIAHGRATLADYPSLQHRREAVRRAYYQAGNQLANDLAATYGVEYHAAHRIVDRHFTVRF